MSKCKNSNNRDRDNSMTNFIDSLVLIYFKLNKFTEIEYMDGKRNQLSRLFLRKIYNITSSLMN